MHTNQSITTIILTGGGSGGHITPLLSLARALKDISPSCQTVYVGLLGDKLEGLRDRYQVFDEVCYVPAGKFRRYHGETFWAHLADIRTLALNTRDFFRMIRGIFAARRLLRRIKPDIVFSKGSFVAVPVGIAARLAHIPIVTHDSDAVPGLANRIVGRWAAIHATGMPIDLYDYPKNTIRHTGIPVDERIKTITPKAQAAFKEQLGITPDRLVLLIGGAGLGSRDVNNLTLKIAPQLLDKLPDLHIIHITGETHLAETNSKYQTVLSPETLKSRVTTLGFTTDFYKYSGAADLIITRAGATTLAELAIQRKACLLIPATFLPGGHQLANVKTLTEAGVVATLSKDVSSENLLKMTVNLLQNAGRRTELATNLGKQAHPQASRELARIIFQVVAGHKVQ